MSTQVAEHLTQGVASESFFYVTWEEKPVRRVVVAHERGPLVWAEASGLAAKQKLLKKRKINILTAAEYATLQGGK